MLTGLRSGERNGSHSGDDDRGMDARPGGVAPNGLSTEGGQRIKRAGKGPLGTYQTLKFMSARELSHSFSMELRISLTVNI